ncbi:MAG: hypothetical protein ACI4PR_04585 [Acutalibacteraceae bacterium]
MAEISLRKSLDFFIKLESDLLKACKGKNLKCGKIKLEDKMEQYFKLDFKAKDGKEITVSLKDLKIKYDEYIGTGESKNGNARAACISALVFQMANLKVNMMGPMKVLADKRKVQYGNKDNILAEKAMESAEAKISGYLEIGADVSNMKDVNDELKKCTKVMGKIYDVWEKKYEKKLKNILEKLGNIVKGTVSEIKKHINEIEKHISEIKKSSSRQLDTKDCTDVFSCNKFKEAVDVSAHCNIDKGISQLKKFCLEENNREISFSNSLVNGIKETITKGDNKLDVTFVENVKQAVKIYDKMEKELDSWNENRATYGRYLTALKKIEYEIRKKEGSDENVGKEEADTQKNTPKGKILRTLVGYNIKPNGYKYKDTFDDNDTSMVHNIVAEDKEVINVYFFLKTLKSFIKSGAWKEIKKNAKNAAKETSGEEAAKEAALADAASLVGEVNNLMKKIGEGDKSLCQIKEGDFKDAGPLLNDICYLWVIKGKEGNMLCIGSNSIVGESVYASNFKKIYDAFERVKERWTNFSNDKTNWSNGDKKHIRKYSVAFQKIKSTAERFRDKIMRDFKKYYPNDNDVGTWKEIVKKCGSGNAEYILEDISNTVANSSKKRRMPPPRRDFQKYKEGIIAYFKSLKESLETDKEASEKASNPDKAWFDAMIEDTDTIIKGMGNHKESNYWDDEWEKLRRIKDYEAAGSWNNWYDNYYSVLEASKKIWKEDLPSFKIKDRINPAKDQAPSPAATLPGNNETS